jgi:hypothetical protein
LVILSDDLGSTTGEVEGKRRLISTEIVDVEDELLRQVLGVTPHDPADTGINETVLVTRNVD